MMVSSAASREESVSLPECQRSKRPAASRRASSWLFQERMPGEKATMELPVSGEKEGGTVLMWVKAESEGMEGVLEVSEATEGAGVGAEVEGVGEREKE